MILLHIKYAYLNSIVLAQNAFFFLNFDLNGIDTENVFQIIFLLTFSAHVIEELTILEAASETSPPPQRESTVVVTKPVAKRANKPVSENIAHNKQSTNGFKPLSTPSNNTNELSPRKGYSDVPNFQLALCKFMM